MENHDFQSIIEGESRRSNSVHYLNTHENISKETVKEYSEEAKEELYQEKKEKEIFVENERKSNEAEMHNNSRVDGSPVSNRMYLAQHSALLIACELKCKVIWRIIISSI